MEKIVNRDYQLLSGYSMPVLGLGTWRLAGATCERIVSAAVELGYRLIDMNSRNGTYVNGVRILEHPLASFDEIQIGSTKIKFLIHVY